MALSSFPLINPSTSSSSSSHSLYFLLLHSQPHFSNPCRALKFRVSSSYRSAQVDTQQHPQRVKKVAFEITKKKNRKPKPSFLEQIRDKWSTKLGSPREKFPWQEQQEQERIDDDGGSDAEEEAEIKVDGKAASKGDHPVGLGMQRRLISAPWSHGTKTHSRNFNGFEEHCDNRVANSVEKAQTFEQVDRNSGFQREFDAKSDSVSKGDWKAEEKTMSVDGNGVSLSEMSSEDAKDVLDVVHYHLDSSHSAGEPSKRRAKLDYAEGKKGSCRRKSNTDLAEQMVPEHELQRLRNVSLRMLERIKVGVKGITGELVETIHEKWKLDEVVKLKFEEPLSLNMKRTHDLLETKTGGLVIWRSGSSVVLYRGMAYNLPCVKSYAGNNQSSKSGLPDSEDVMPNSMNEIGVNGVGETTESSVSNEHPKDPSKGEPLDLSDLNSLLDELGPRFEDWLGREPLPVDADLLPPVVPGYKTPFRLLPHGVRHCLSNKGMTKFRRLARTVPPHFALGRNRELQGLANAMVKLWEKSAIAKIAIKRGVENTCNERMAEELRQLTGGTLLSRNKEFIVFYRGNDFLPPAVTEALRERRNLRDLQQDEEEQARKLASASDSIELKTKASSGQLVAGTLAETVAATARWGNQLTSLDVEKMLRDSTLSRHASLIKHLQNKLALAKGKLKKAEIALAEVQENLEPTDLPDDLETLTDEERFLFRKIGLSMKPYLLLGRRGVYDGTIENMHLHWKYRELVKIIVKGKSFQQVKHVAISLEAESGGVLVSLDKTTKGYAIIVYRGKNYLSPLKIRPRNLLSRRQALARSIELQRREALQHHISDLQERIDLLKSELEESRSRKMIDEEGNLHSTENDSNLVNDDDDDGEEAYLEVYDSGNDDNSDGDA
ncbi:CRM-domain containing factor CFM3, chloroplastic/mitochondrial [Ziziphus jujuba]|uniref:CRM-domain containing factor CFM3, chloroplastic/mitochondrial n=2 Tax=Ziziphus jujuba TaxID=326968 RepID=A0A6P6GBR3_ZIZJJ|nr:CRM-domain containing factor CFM3, chloroplastic/mitochondrial [Ziziphus jujuba]